ncbi:MAG: redoxin domain-containing protein [Armatimonadetes bacterium]|nr:redoxin domain-containing protein [Armatimonadota bacterium]
MRIARYLLLLTVLLTSGCTLESLRPKGELAVPFKGLSPQDNQHYSLLDQLKERPVVAVFIPAKLDQGKKSLALFELIQEAYGDKVKVLGVYAGTEAGCVAWLKLNKVKFTVFPDPDGFYTTQYHFSQGPSTIFVTQDSHVAVRADQLTSGSVDKLVTTLEAKIGKPTQPIDIESVKGNLPKPIDY